MAITIGQLQKDTWRIMEKSGFHDDAPTNPKDPMYNLGRLMLIVSELAESAEDIRDGNWTIITHDADGTYHPRGFPIELADAIIRIVHMAEVLGINLEDAVHIKQSYNETRPYKHNRLV